ncbi:MAG: carbohydrate kinase [Lysinibacillus sp.]
MSEKEQLVLGLIRENPYLSQQEMAEKVGLSRPALANIISTLIKRGEIIGRAYVLPERQAIIAIGGANVDRKFHIDGATQLETSNPASVTTSVGGVARNIAENLGRLGNEVKLLTLLGADHDGEKIKQQSEKYMSFEMTENMLERSTGSYSAVLTQEGELVIALADMEIYNELSPQRLAKFEARIADARCIIIDLNAPKETVEYVLALAREREIPLAVIPVSSPKMNHMPDDLRGLAYFICNRDEAEAYLHYSLQSEEDYKKAVADLLGKGAGHVVITLGSAGVIAGNSEKIERQQAVAAKHIVDVTGAGDAFVSAFLHAVLQNEPFQDAVKFGLYNASATLQCETTVREDLSVNELSIWREM